MPATPPNEESIFAQALGKQSPEERAAFLHAACGEDTVLRARINKLLQRHEEGESFLAKPLGATTAQELITERPGSVIGPYKLKELIGEGGMGLVFVAEQQEPVRRKVALKVIKPGMDTRDVIARFEAERQALALMDHPNIARVLDAGATDSGRPYFVMELVKGIPITDYCDQHALTPRERLELFVSVCQAVQHAHAKGVIHRDLKPSNVLIAPHDGRPVVKVIDFGVAKAIGQPLTDKSIYTRLSQMIGTPMYMSPEQAEINALDVDTRSDIYGLGVLLYELLTGTTPFDRQRLHTAAFDEIRRIIREEEPPKPSTRLTTLGDGLSAMSAKRKTEPGKLSALFKGELDWIVMKALEKDRNRRYETASAMAEDVRRFLSDELVQARPPSAWYRFRKVVRRNKAAAVTVGLVAATLVLGIVGTALGLVRAVDAEAKAITALDEEARQRKLAVANEEKAKDEERKAKAAHDAEQERVRELGIALKKLAAALKNAEEAQKAEKQRAAELAEALKKVAKAQLEAEKNEAIAEWRLYASNIGSAQRAWETNSVSLLYHFLDLSRPSFRGWEHDYLYTLANQNQQTLRGHDGQVTSVAFSPDGKHLASASTYSGSKTPPGEVRLWDAVTGRPLVTFERHKERNMINSLAFSPDGKRLASASASGGRGGPKVTLWDAASGKEIWSVPSGPLCVAFSPDGKYLAGASGTLKVNLWDAANGKELLTLDGHTAQVADGTLNILQGQITSVAFSPDGRRLASASADKTVKLWELASGQEYAMLQGHTAAVRSVAFSPDGKRLASAADDKTVKLWDAATGQPMHTFHGHTGPVKSVAFSPDGKYLASAGGGEDTTVKLWNTTSGEEIRTLKGHAGAVTSVAFSPDGKRLASAAADKTVKLWELGRSQDVLALKENPLYGAFSPDGKYIASASPDNTVKLLDAASGKELLRLKGHTKYLNFLAFSPDGNRLASASADETVILWDVASRKVIRTLKGHAESVISVAFSPDGKRLASGSWDNTVKVWDTASGQEILNLTGHTFWVASVAFSPDGKRLASGSYDKTVKLWDTASGQKLQTLEGHTGVVYSVAFSPDGKRLASASADKTVILWDAISGEQLLPLKGHTGFVESVVFSPDGKRLATASRDKTVKLWDVASGQEVLTLTCAYPVHSMVFSPDGKRLASVGGGGGKGNPSGQIILWDASKSMKELEQK